MAGNVRINQLKLYATTTSERASKGQGGNDRLYISINVGEIKDAIKVSVNRSPTLKAYIATIEMGGKKVENTYHHCYEETKGKQKKDESEIFCEAQVGERLCSNKVYKDGHCSKHHKMFGE